jgi:hypothetical protein
MRWASATPVSEDDDDGEWDDHGQCANCNHWGITWTLCPTCEDTRFIHESTGVGQVGQARLGPDHASRVAWRQQVKAGVQRLLQLGRLGNELPKLGHICLVLQGDVKTDWGQEAVVTKQTAA